MSSFETSGNALCFSQVSFMKRAEIRDEERDTKGIQPEMTLGDFNRSRHTHKWSTWSLYSSYIYIVPLTHITCGVRMSKGRAAV